VGPGNDSHPAVVGFHRLLVWDIEKAPRLTRYADRLLNPLVGKSLVVYLEKPAAPARVPSPDERSTAAAWAPAPWSEEAAVDAAQSVSEGAVA
jgi:hypothetical protein